MVIFGGVLPTLPLAVVSKSLSFKGEKMEMELLTIFGLGIASLINMAILIIIFKLSPVEIKIYEQYYCQIQAIAKNFILKNSEIIEMNEILNKSNISGKHLIFYSLFKMQGHKDVDIYQIIPELPEKLKARAVKSAKLFCFNSRRSYKKEDELILLKDIEFEIVINAFQFNSESNCNLHDFLVRLAHRRITKKDLNVLSIFDLKSYPTIIKEFPV